MLSQKKTNKQTNKKRKLSTPNFIKKNRFEIDSTKNICNISNHID